MVETFIFTFNLYTHQVSTGDGTNIYLHFFPYTRWAGMEFWELIQLLPFHFTLYTNQVYLYILQMIYLHSLSTHSKQGWQSGIWYKYLHFHLDFYTPYSQGRYRPDGGCCHQTTSTRLDQVRLCLSPTLRVMLHLGGPNIQFISYLLSFLSLFY